MLPETSAYVMSGAEKRWPYEPTECGGGVTAVPGRGDP